MNPNYIIDLEERFKAIGITNPPPKALELARTRATKVLDEDKTELMSFVEALDGKSRKKYTRKTEENV
ncbi:MAG: hypothetical protein PHD76_00565 [Methylacidiphilales bacterium]|nr:hypothetical protein [Candidatus Methylacidiphilales bacterium]